MALRPDNTLISNREILTELVLAPFYALARSIDYLAENNVRTKALREIAEMSDAELEASGTTRSEAIRRALQHYI